MLTALPQVAPFLDAQKHALEMVVKGAPLCEVLAFLTGVVERVSQHATVASILLLDKEGRLRPGAAPSLPEDYIRAIDGLKAEPTLGTCSAAAATGRVVVTRDFATDPAWVTLRHLPLALGLIGAWSQPIIDRHGRVLGTFGTYFREIREPSPAERQVVEILSHTAALAIERSRFDEAQREAERVKDEFIATLSHEMRNPLAPLRAALQMLPSSVHDPDTLLRLHGRMSRSVEQLVRLVDDLLEAARISRGELQLQHEPVDLKDVVAAAVETCAPVAQSSRVSIRIDVAEAPVLVSGDRLQPAEQRDKVHACRRRSHRLGSAERDTRARIGARHRHRHRRRRHRPDLRDVRADSRTGQSVAVGTGPRPAAGAAPRRHASGHARSAQQRRRQRQRVHFAIAAAAVALPQSSGPPGLPGHTALAASSCASSVADSCNAASTSLRYFPERKPLARLK